MPEQGEDGPGVLSTRELQDIIERLGQAETRSSFSDGADVGADAILADALDLKSLIVKMKWRAPGSLAERVVAAALQADPAPDPAAIHQLDKKPL